MDNLPLNTLISTCSSLRDPYIIEAHKKVLKAEKEKEKYIPRCEFIPRSYSIKITLPSISVSISCYYRYYEILVKWRQMLEILRVNGDMEMPYNYNDYTIRTRKGWTIFSKSDLKVKLSNSLIIPAVEELILYIEKCKENASPSALNID